MKPNARFIVGGAIIAAALAYMVYAGLTQSAVYFITPSELQAAPVAGKAYRLGGMVVAGSVRWNAGSLDLAFTLSDGKASVPVRHKGTPPDLFGEGRGAVVEGRWVDGYFKASQIMAKHSEDYKAPHPGEPPAGYPELFRTLDKDGGSR